MVSACFMFRLDPSSRRLADALVVTPARIPPSFPAVRCLSAPQVQTVIRLITMVDFSIVVVGTGELQLQQVYGAAIF